MIDQETFKTHWSLLCERFRSAPSHALMMAYYRSLSPRMTTNELKVAAQRLFDGADFLPKPDDFVAAVAPDPEAAALGQWEVFLDLMKGRNVYEQLTAESKRIVRMLGGERKLRDTPLDEVKFVRREFFQLYSQANEIAERERDRRIEPTAEANRIAAAVLKGMDPNNRRDDHGHGEKA